MDIEFYVRDYQRGGTTYNTPGHIVNVEYPRQTYITTSYFHINNLDNQFKIIVYQINVVL